MTPIVLDDEYSYPLHNMGGVGTLTVEAQQENIVERLHAVILEVTGKPVVVVEKPRMGFLP